MLRRPDRIGVFSVGFMLFLLTLPHAIQAHNGAVALAVPVEGITIDGDLSDWPPKMTAYPIARRQAGAPLKGAADFQGAFRIGYHTEENALYIAVEVVDDSVVRQARGEESWNTQDGCEIYLDLSREDEFPPPIQYYIRGSTLGLYPSNSGNLKGVAAQVSWQENGYSCEWRIDLDRQNNGRSKLHPQMVIGFDVSLWDKDADGSASWIAWGKGAEKYLYAPDLGDVVLVDRVPNLEQNLSLLPLLVEHSRRGRESGPWNGGADPRELERRIQTAFTVLPVAFGLLHLFLFLFFRPARENLFFAGFLIFTSLTTFLDYQNALAADADSADLYLALHRAFSPFALIFLLRFVYAIFAEKPPIQFWLLSLGALATAAAAVYHDDNYLYFSILILIFSIEIWRETTQALRRQKAGARIIAVGLSLQLLFAAYDWLLGVSNKKVVP
ncbi:MAG: hypothetical protein GKR89_35825 [Candidatus Latescibacteria bacterium]|nr:hypothetical protein [Candidatus Latescibacterota bacterium]